MTIYTPFESVDQLNAKELNRRFKQLSDALDALAAYPTGSIIPFAGSVAPTGWLFCNAFAYSRTDYAALFAVIDTNYGLGDGSTTFNVPDLRGRAMIGTGTGSGLTARTLAQKVGEENHQLTIPEMPAHTHPNAQTTNNVGGAGGTNGNATSTPSSSAGSDTAHNNMQPSLVVNFIIKT